MRTRAYATGVAMIIILMLAAGCGSDDDTAGASSDSPAPASSAADQGAADQGAADITWTTPGTLKVGTSPLGPILTDHEGRTLYGLTSDIDGTSTCASGCTAMWPPMIIRSPIAGSGVDAAKLGSTERPNGAPQVVYGKQPLYYFAGDINPGDVMGQGVGDKWYAVAPDGRLLESTG